MLSVLSIIFSLIIVIFGIHCGQENQSSMREKCDNNLIVQIDKFYTNHHSKMQCHI